MNAASSAAPWVFEPRSNVRPLSPVLFSPWASREDWFSKAIEVLGDAQVPTASTPLAVIVRVVTRRPRSITPELAKRLLDTLHDRKHLPPHYRDRQRVAVLADDDPRYVSALAIELRAGDVERVDFLLAQNVAVKAELLGSVDVGFAAPNDVSGGGAEEVVRQRVRTSYVAALRDGWPATLHPGAIARCTHLVVRHGAQRDEDNTWATWIGALRSTASWTGSGWLPLVPPLAASWRAIGVASSSDAALAGRVRYEFYAALPHEPDAALTG